MIVVVKVFKDGLTLLNFFCKNVLFDGILNGP
jgi:hypothetical protein